MSRLCFWAVEYGKTSAEYGLRLPGLDIPLGRGQAHQERVLRALALYGMPEQAEGGERG
nr:hypothetical protein [Marinimicrobium sp.]